MIKIAFLNVVRLLLLAALAGVGGCASSEVEPELPVYFHVTVPGGDELLEHRDLSGKRQLVEPPIIREEPPEIASQVPLPQGEIVCRWEIPTGSRLRKKVCSEKSFVEKKREADQEIFDDIKRNTAIGNANRY